MTKVRVKVKRNADSGKFVVDGAYFRSQAREAIKTFVGPYTGVYEAITGSERRYVQGANSVRATAASARSQEKRDHRKGGPKG